MSNKTATLKVSLTYTGTAGEAATAPTKTVSVPYQGQGSGTIDIPDATAADTEYEVPFGSIAEATLLKLENNSGQDLLVKVNEAPSASGTLVAGTKDILLDNVVGDRLSVEMTTSGGTPGVLSVNRKSATEVTVQSWLAGTGLQTADVSVVKVYNHGTGYTHRLPTGGVFMPQGAPAAAGAVPVTSVKVKTTGSQSGDGLVAYHLYGDPT